MEGWSELFLTFGKQRVLFNLTPPEAEEVNSVGRKHLVNNQVYTFNRWPAIFVRKQKEMDDFFMWYRGFQPDVYIPVPGSTMQTPQSKEKITHILSLRGKESKMRILDILLQRNLEYAKSLKVKHTQI